MRSCDTAMPRRCHPTVENQPRASGKLRPAQPLYFQIENATATRSIPYLLTQDQITAHWRTYMHHPCTLTSTHIYIDSGLTIRTPAAVQSPQCSSAPDHSALARTIFRNRRRALRHRDDEPRLITQNPHTTTTVHAPPLYLTDPDPFTTDPHSTQPHYWPRQGCEPPSGITYPTYTPPTLVSSKRWQG